MTKTTNSNPKPGSQFGPGKKTAAAGSLALIVGGAVAVALGVATPAEESGRVVEASLNEETGNLEIQHVRGRQYLSVYIDMVGVPTVCDGITTYKGRRLDRNREFSEEECAAMLEYELAKHARGVMDCTPGFALNENEAVEEVLEGPRFAAVSLAYNVGVGAYCRSTAMRRFNRGNFKGGCEALKWWNRAGGRVVRGLVNRRQREYEVCMNGLSAHS